MTIQFDSGDRYNFQRGYADEAKKLGLDESSVAACVDAGLAMVACTKSTRHYAPDPGPVPMLLWCPICNARHLDVGDFATKPHHTHACQTCGHCWRPAVVATCGVQFLPGFKNEVAP